MDETLDPALVEAYATCRSNVSHIHTLQLEHPSLDAPLYLVQGHLHRQLTIEDDVEVIFRACAFNFTRPRTDDSGAQELTLTLDDANRMVSDFCEVAMTIEPPEPVVILYRPYLSTDLTKPLMDPPLRLFLTNVKITGTQCSGRAVPMDFLNLQFPSEDYDRQNFPGLGD